MRIVSWNVNGIRSIMKKNFRATMKAIDADILCLQETKAQDHQVVDSLKGLNEYHLYTNSAARKGYSGTAILTKNPPISDRKNMNIEEHDQEGRVISLEFDRYYVVTVYTPNSGSELKRLIYRQKWDVDFLSYLMTLEIKKPVIACGDFNVAHREIDLARPKENYNKNAGYMQEEIDGMNNLLSARFIDTFRHVKPNEIKYSWWSFRTDARKRNIGWRIDYILISPQLIGKVRAVNILNQVHGSDHCPVLLDLDH